MIKVLTHSHRSIELENGSILTEVLQCETLEFEFNPYRVAREVREWLEDYEIPMDCEALEDIIVNCLSVGFDNVTDYENYLCLECEALEQNFHEAVRKALREN